MKFNDVEFSLTDNFLNKYKRKQPPFGPLGYFAFKRTYARPLPGGKTEEWWQTVRRVVEGCFIIQKAHCKGIGLPWSERMAQRSAQEMFKLMWDFKFLPPGRGLWAMGTDFLFDKGSACLNNCGFVSTENIADDFSAPFVWLMDMSMMGVGVGFDTEGAYGKEVFLKEPRVSKETFAVPDSREGWVDAFRRVLDAFSGADTLPESWDYSQIRPAGEPIRGFGGVAPGSDPLRFLVDRTSNLLKSYTDDGKPVDSTLIVDLMNLAGAAVVAGGIRRTAEIAFGRMDDEAFHNLKLQENIDNKNLARWASNNSLMANLGEDYSIASSRSAVNGEPGFFWLENARAYGRTGDGKNWKDHRAKGCNPCGEQTLESFELCVTGDTRIQTESGAPYIKDVTGKPVKIWNGKEWSPVTPFQTSKDSQILRVHFNDGSYLDCTEYHRFSARAKTRRHFVVKKAKDLVTGDIMPSFTLGSPAGKPVEWAYEYGLFAGDGYMDRKVPMLSMQEAAVSQINPEGTLYKSQHPEGYSEPVQRVRLTSLDSDLCSRLKADYSFLFTWDNQAIKAFTAGLIDTDGSVGNQGKTGEYYRIYGNETNLRTLQLALRRAGINSTTLREFQPEGCVTNKGVRSQALWMLNVHSHNCGEIPTRYRRAIKLGSGQRVNNRHPSSMVSNVVNQKVTRVEVLDRQPTYCFYEPKEGMGVFGNVLTYQCNLVETFPSRHDSIEDYKRTLKYAYMYAKTTTLLPTHDPRTNAVMMRNRRIGLSQSGIIENINRIGFRSHIDWCEDGYQVVQHWDQVYSDWLCVPKSIKTTTVKPSGTVSLLPGVTPGIHFPHSEYYIRRVRLPAQSDLWKKMEEAGYEVEDDSYSKQTKVVSFPVHEPHFDRRKDEVSLWEQLELAAAMQAKWSDNQVSITVTVKPEEAQDLPRALSMYEKRLKAVSFLPLRGDQVYKQAPYEAITAEQFKEMSAGLKKVKLNPTDEEDRIIERFCDGEVCTI